MAASCCVCRSIWPVSGRKSERNSGVFYVWACMQWVRPPLQAHWELRTPLQLGCHLQLRPPYRHLNPRRSRLLPQTTRRAKTLRAPTHPLRATYQARAAFLPLPPLRWAHIRQQQAAIRVQLAYQTPAQGAPPPATSPHCVATVFHLRSKPRLGYRVDMSRRRPTAWLL